MYLLRNRNYNNSWSTFVFAPLLLFLFGILVQNAFADQVVATIPVGTNPSGIGVNPNSNMIYVSNLSDSTVSVIDGNANTVVGTIPGIILPLGLSVNPVTNMIYVVEMNANAPAVAVIDGSTNTVVKTIQIPFSTSGTNSFYDTVDPVTNMIYVTYYSTEHFGKFGGGPSDVAIINGTTNTYVGKIALGQYGHGISANPNTNKIYVAASGCLGTVPPPPCPYVTVIDGSTNSIVDNINASNHPNFVAVNPNTNTIYSTDLTGNQLVVIDGKTDSIITQIPVGSGPYGVDVNPITNKIYVDNEAGSTVSVINGTSNQIFATVPVGSGPYNVAINPNTDRIFVTNYYSNTVSVIDGSLSTVPFSPNNLNATAVSSSQINLSWNAPASDGGSTITGYEIERSADGGSTWSTITSNTGSAGTTYSDTGLAHSTTYTYRVSAINSVGTSVPSSTASATTFNVVPSPPTGLTATAQLLKINLNWNAPSDNGGTPITGYMIERSTDNGSTWSTIVSNTGNVGTTYLDTNVLPLTTYTYRVSAINDIGTGNPSNTASASTPSVGPITPPSLP